MAYDGGRFFEANSEQRFGTATDVSTFFLVQRRRDESGTEAFAQPRRA
jgi:hypothetical protein